ncbi:element excision factor XisH family protein [Rudanella lutea]|uniref:element excision factor XisH family protein n=1 Tax=Rudanella lutea TaxID=451374 RepID=UPI00036F9FC0|nr:element excision factor XisH family protein [Rudanella lutea]
MAKDIFHDIVKTVLQQDGWTITHDPLTLKLSKRNLFIDLGAERIMAAERDNQKIAIEVKSFVGLSPLTDFYKALGQYQLNILALKRKMPYRVLYLAMPQESYETLMNDDILAEFLNELSLRYIIFDPKNKQLVQWIN